MEALKNDLLTFNKKLKFSGLTESTLTAFVVYLRDEKKLGYLKWFLKWATNKGYNTNIAYKTFKPTLKATQKKVIYLNKEELKAIVNLELKGETLYLETVRDIFLFCCFSSLRYSDASSLK